MTKDAYGIKGQQKAAQWLKGLKVKCHVAARYAPFDIFTPFGTRIEVKTATFRETDPGKWGWTFNLHRHGVLPSEEAAEIYIFRLETGELVKFGMHSATHLVIPKSQLGRVSTVGISIRSLMAYYGKFFNKVDAIRDADKQKSPEYAAETVILAQIGTSHRSRAIRKQLLKIAANGSERRA